MKSTQPYPQAASVPLATSLPPASDIAGAAITVRRRRGIQTQVERSSEMRLRIMSATLECLATVGYTGTTFGAVAKLAGVSRGALQHHYPERNFLIAGALELLSYQLEPDILADAKKKPAGRKRLVYVLDTLWAASLSTTVTAIHDVRAAARTDSRLQQMLLPVEHRVRDRQYIAISEAFGGAFAASKQYRSRIDAIFATMRGLAISIGLGWDRPDIDAAWQRAREDFVTAFLNSRNTKKGS